jgi:hypothetical protein
MTPCRQNRPPKIAACKNKGLNKVYVLVGNQLPLRKENDFVR